MTITMTTTTPVTGIGAGDRVDGRDGPLGEVAGTREAAAGHPASVLVRLARLFGLLHTTRLVPVAWVTDAPSDARRVTLDATRAEVAGCPSLREDPDMRADVVQALTQDPVTRQACLRVVSRLGEVELGGELPAAATPWQRHGERPELVAPSDRLELARTGGWVWCASCGRAWPVADLRLVYAPEVARAGYPAWAVCCADPRCGGASPGIDLFGYADLRREAHPQSWPERPQAGQYLPAH